jgi:hypothetical protein|tara:strand:+ start:2761 stop:2919 length:159 start_codon:yes stop_codon:yes gene_type:complete
MRGVWIFVELWLASLMVLPVQCVGVAFCAPLIALTPGTVEIHRQVQNEIDPY